jgi:hypothetical protein
MINLYFAGGSLMLIKTEGRIRSRRKIIQTKPMQDVALAKA